MENSKVTAQQNTRLPRKTTQRYLACFIAGLGILIIGGKEFFPPLQIRITEAAHPAAFSIGYWPLHADFRKGERRAQHSHDPRRYEPPAPRSGLLAPGSYPRMPHSQPRTRARTPAEHRSRIPMQHSCSRTICPRFNHRAVRTHDCRIRHHESGIHAHDATALSSIIGRSPSCCRACQHNQVPRNQTDAKLPPPGGWVSGGEQIFACHRLLATGHWPLATGYWRLTADSRPPATGCSPSPRRTPSGHAGIPSAPRRLSTPCGQRGSSRIPRSSGVPAPASCGPGRTR